MAQMSNFTFFNNVFYAICILIATLQLSSAASLNLGQSQNLVLGNVLRTPERKPLKTDYQHFILFPQCFLSINMTFHLTLHLKRQNFRLVQIKAFAEDKINVTQTLKFVLRKVGNIVRKGEHAGYQNFLLFPQCF